MRCSEKSKRRTKTVAGTLEPKWNQTFIYSPMKRQDINTRALEVTVYDYDRCVRVGGCGRWVGVGSGWVCVGVGSGWVVGGWMCVCVGGGWVCIGVGDRCGY